MIQRDYYQVLGVSREASHGAIRAAFIRLVKRHHPDFADEDADLPWRLQEIQHAYRCLSDDQTRAAHDHALDEIARQHFARQRTVQRQLRRYDQRHPQPQIRGPGRLHWPSLVVAVVGIALLTAISFKLAG